MSKIVDYEAVRSAAAVALLARRDRRRNGWVGRTGRRGRSKTVRTAVEELFDTYLLGEDAGRIEDHWQTMYRGGFYRGGPVLMSAIAGVDQALWDIKGKQLDVPVYELLGGAARERIRVYQWIGGDRPSDVAEQARKQVEAGFTALKMNATEEIERVDDPATIDAAATRLREVREAVGDEVGIGVDFHGRVSKPMAKRLVEALEPYDPMFVEEPVLSGHNDALPKSPHTRRRRSRPASACIRGGISRKSSRTAPST